MSLNIIDHMTIFLLICFVGFVGYGLFLWTTVIDKPDKHRKHTPSSLKHLIEDRITLGMGVAPEMQVLKAMIERDTEYAWTWYCNLVMSYVGNGCSRITAIKGTASFMRLLFDHDITNDARYMSDLRDASNKKEPIK